jgi:ketosteroid isomerase-like protein
MKPHLGIVPLLLMTSLTLADVSDEVRCQEIGFSRSVESQNVELFASFIDADARFIGSGVLRGRTEVADAWAIFFTAGGPRIKWRPRFVEVLQDGKLALTRGPYRMITTDEQGTETEHWGTFNSVWRLQPDGSWQVVFDAGSDSNAPPSAEIRALLDQGGGC